MSWINLRTIYQISKLKPLAKDGDADSQYRLGVLYHNGGALFDTHQKAAMWYRKAAEQGHAQAQFCLRNLLQQAKGVQLNYTEAASWYYKSAKQGNTKAALHLGRLYKTGKGVKQNFKNAAKLYLAAAKDGNSEAQYYLGRLYHNGNGLEQDDEKAVEWLKRASENGHAGARSLLKEITGISELWEVKASEIELMPDDKADPPQYKPTSLITKILVLLFIALAAFIVIILVWGLVYDVLGLFGVIDAPHVGKGVARLIVYVFAALFVGAWLSSLN